MDGVERVTGVVAVNLDPRLHQELFKGLAVLNCGKRRGLESVG